MGVSLNSRYANGHFSRSFPDPRRFRRDRESRGGFLGPVQEVTPVVIRTTTKPTRVSSVYVWRRGDRWDTVADKFGIPRTDWWVILDANPQIEFPLSVRPGEYINIPDSLRRRVQ